MSIHLSSEQAIKRGRKERDQVAICQSAYWAWWIRLQLDMDFSKIERMLNPNCFEHREDIGGYKQPQLWRKYGLGQISPIGNGRNGKNAVQQAEVFCPGSSEVFHSVLWELLRTEYPNKEQLKHLAYKLPTSTKQRLFRSSKRANDPWDYISRLSIKRLREFARSSDIATLAVLLMHLHTNRHYLEKVKVVALITWWLNHCVLIDGPTKAVAYLLLPALEAHQPLLGSLESLINIKHKLPEQSHLDKAFESVFIGRLLL